MPESDFLSRLQARRPELEALEPSWQMIDDVLSGRIKHRSAGGWSSPYFPKGRLEPQAEYSLRVELTPFFPETPQLLASRLGALFKTPPQLDLFAAEANKSDAQNTAWKARINDFLKHAGRRHSSFEDVAVQAACLAQTHGFCAALLDRDPLPPDLMGREVSQAEATTRGLGRPYIALFSAPDILDWSYGSDGLLNWVKFSEEESTRPSWDADPQPTRTFRIVDRQYIHVYQVRKDAEGVWQVAAQPPLAHGYNGVPVVFLHPFPSQDGIGRPILQRAVEADVAAARILSDLTWDLFLLGNPILTLKTNRSPEDLRSLQVGASRYIPLRNGQVGLENPESLEFVQLDPTGIELLFRAYTLFSAQALKQVSSDGSSEAASSIPHVQSGVAQAWRFKTGEERVLFRLARALEPFLTSCLQLAAEALSQCGTVENPLNLAHSFCVMDTLEVSAAVRQLQVRLPQNFDVASTSELLADSEKIIDLATRLGQTELAKFALQRIESLLGTLPSDRSEALAKERAALKL